MLTALLTFLVGGGLIHLLVDGAKAASQRYDAAKGIWKQVLCWGLALALVLVMRGFDLPNSLWGWCYFLGSVAIVGLVAQGWFRMRQPKIVSFGPLASTTKRRRSNKSPGMPAFASGTASGSGSIPANRPNRPEDLSGPGRPAV